MENLDGLHQVPRCGFLHEVAGQGVELGNLGDVSEDGTLVDATADDLKDHVKSKGLVSHLSLEFRHPASSLPQLVQVAS